jgi:colicin import membrane protein
MDFRRSLVFSAIFHLCLLLVGFITFPSAMTFQTQAIASIPVDLISEAPQVKGAIQAPKMEQPEVRKTPTPVIQPDDVKPIDSPKPVEPKTAPEKPEETVSAPPEEKEKAPPPAPSEKKADELDPEGLLKKVEEAKKEEEKKQQEELKKQEAKRKAEEKKKLAEEKRKAEEQRLAKQAQKFDADKISNLLNKQEGAQRPKTEAGAEQKQASLGNPKGEGKALTQSQIGLMQDMIEKQVLPCYVSPPGAPDDLVVELHMAMNPDGSLNGRPQVTNSSSNPVFRAMADAAVRAVLRCSPLKLPPEWYAGTGGWKDIGYQFNKQH